MGCCTLCPRRCGADRERGEIGLCHTAGELFVARIAPHYFEEPPISGKNGSGTVFFSGCSLGCVFCQNREISIDKKGETVDEARLAEIFRALEGAGAECLDLVTATHFAPSVFAALDMATPSIPEEYQTSSESVTAAQ